MRTLLFFALALAATPALAAEPTTLSCQAVSAAEADWASARQALEEAKYVAFSDAYEAELAVAHAEDRDAMAAARDQAKIDVPKLRKTARAAKKTHKGLAHEAEAQGLICTTT